MVWKKYNCCKNSKSKITSKEISKNYYGIFVRCFAKKDVVLKMLLNTVYIKVII